MIDQETFTKQAIEAYRRLQGMTSWRIHLFRDGSLSEPVTGGTAFYIEDTGENATEFVFKGWDPIDIPCIYDEGPDGETVEGYYYDVEAGIWVNDFTDFILEWIEEDWNQYESSE